MNYIEFWEIYTRMLKSAPGWVVFGNGTLVHPEGESAEDVLQRLHNALGGYSGAGSPYGDIYVKEVFDGHIVVSYDECVGLLLSVCHKSELGETAGGEDMIFAAGMLCRNRRNMDAASRTRIG